MTTSTLDMRGTRIGSYHFVRRLGDGAQATVWLAEERDHRGRIFRHVAIKVFEANDDPAELRVKADTFGAESAILAKLSNNKPIVIYHTSKIVPIALSESGVIETYGSRVANDQPESSEARTIFMIVMEYADGGYLGDGYRSEVVTGRYRAQYYNDFLDICTALQAAHDNGITHRDVKPRNILWFKTEGLVKVTDFGVAHHPNAQGALDSGFAAVVGTPPYMAPEAFDGEAGPAVDVYALGCTFFEILTGQPAFTLPQDERTIGEWKDLHGTARRPDAISQAVDTVTIGLSAFLKTMMDSDPTQRPKIRQVVQFLKDEMRRGLPTQVDHKTISLPWKPVERSDYLVSAEFRRDDLYENLYYIFLEMPL